MRIRRLELARYSLPLRRPLATARGLISRREGLLLTLIDEGGCRGRGEAAPLPGWSAESLSEAQEALRCAAPLLEGSAIPDSPEGIAAVARDMALPPSAAHAVDQAMLSLLAAARGLPLARLLSPGARAAVPISRLVHGPEDAAAAARSGIRVVKLKVAALPLGEDIARVAATRAALGEAVAIRLDANGGWSEGQAAEALERLAPLGIECVEDPVHSLDAMARLRRLGVPLAADAPLRGPADLERILRAGAADLVVIKPSFVGGISAGLELLRAASAAGLELIVTTALGAAVERWGALHLAAAAPAGLRPCGLDTGGLLTRDIGEGPVARGGRMEIV